MDNIKNTTITPLEVAEKMEVSHNDILRKLDGRKDHKGFIGILAESQMAVSDFFIPSAYEKKQVHSYTCIIFQKYVGKFLLAHQVIAQ